MPYDKRYGGGALPFRHAVAAMEEIAAASAAVAIRMITIYWAQSMITLFGSDRLKQEYLPQFSEGLLSSYALTEASHGSDIRSLDTKAVRSADGWTISGEKHFITSGSAAFIIVAQAEGGVSVFGVPRDVPGLSLYKGHNSATFGLRNGPHMNVRLDNVRLSLHHLIGTEGKGVRQAVTVLDYSRTAISVGITRAAFEGSLAFARERSAFDKRILEFQELQWYFSKMLTEIDATRLLIYRAADAHDEIARYSSAAKLKASSVASVVASKAVQIAALTGPWRTHPTAATCATRRPTRSRAVPARSSKKRSPRASCSTRPAKEPEA